MDVAAEVARQGARSQGLVTSAQLEAAGVSRQALSRAVHRGEVVRVRRRVYGLAALRVLPRYLVTGEGPAPELVAVVRAVLLSLGGSAAACGRTAAALYGWGLLVEPRRTVEVAVPHGSDVRRAGVRVTQRRSAARSRVRVLAGTVRLRLTSPLQTAVDCALHLPLLEAVVACDSALRSGAVSLEELHRAASRLRGTAGADRVRRVLARCDPRCGSVLESVLRLALVEAGVGGFTTQAVLASGPVPVRVDFCFADAGLVVEVDGARWHTDAARDQARDNLLAQLGWRVIRLTWAEVVHDTDRVLADLQAALAAVAVVPTPGSSSSAAA